MAMRVRRFAVLLGTTALVAGLLVAPKADALTLTFGTLLSGSFQPSASFAELTVDPVGMGGDVYDFTLSAFDLDTLFTPGAFIGSIAVDLSPSSAALPAISNAFGGSPVSAQPGGGPTGVWDFRFDLTGPMAARLTANEDVSWRATFGEPVTFIDSMFALHAQGLTGPQGGSAWYVVPEPETYAMLLAGLGLLGLMLRRRLAG